MATPSTIFVGRDREGRSHLIAALEDRPHGALGREGARARVMLLPGLARLADDDFRGRRINLETLLAPDPLLSEPRTAIELLGDLGSHLGELPELGAPGRPQDFRIPLQVRFLGSQPPELTPLVPAPGGGFFELDLAPVRLPRDARGGLLCTRADLGGPWITQTSDPDAHTAGTFALLAEAGFAGLRPDDDSFLDAWVRRDREQGGAGLAGAPADRALDELRALLGAMLGGGPGDGDQSGASARVSRTRGGAGWIWTFELRADDRTASLTFEAARVTDAALARLKRAGATPLVPWWLLLFERDASGGALLTEVFDARAYLARHPELWERTSPDPLSPSVPADAEPLVDGEEPGP